MADKPHLLYTKSPEGVETFKYSRRGGGGKDKPTDEQKADRTGDSGSVDHVISPIFDQSVV